MRTTPIGYVVRQGMTPSRDHRPEVSTRLLRIQEDLDDARDRFEARHGLRAEKIMHREVLKALKAWQVRFPKRHILFEDFGGIAVLRIDGRDLDDIARISCVGSLGANKRRQDLVAPLVAIYEWYAQVFDDNFKHCIETIDLEPILKAT